VWYFLKNKFEMGKQGYLMPFVISTEYIKLDSFLKGVSVVGSGGEAKIIIADSQVRVNGEIEIRRGRKLYPGDRVELGGHVFTVKREE
jgi:ribosome-associated protein